jgi:hypothetical protein
MRNIKLWLQLIAQINVGFFYRANWQSVLSTEDRSPEKSLRERYQENFQDQSDAWRLNSDPIHRLEFLFADSFVLCSQLAGLPLEPPRFDRKST